MWLKRKFKLLIVSIVSIGIGGKALLNYNTNEYWYSTRKAIAHKYEVIDALDLKQYGPYCIIEVIIKREIDFGKAEDIFIELLLEINEPSIKQKLLERQHKVAHSELAFFEIRFKRPYEIENSYSFEAALTDNFTVWTLDENKDTRVCPIQYNVKDYTNKE